MILDLNIPLTESVFMEEATCGTVPIVETDDIDDASSSSPLPVIPLNRFEAVELCLFFFGIGGRIFPGNSVRNLLCSLAKSPYRLPMKNSNSFFLLTLKMNSCHQSAFSTQVCGTRHTACL